MSWNSKYIIKTKTFFTDISSLLQTLNECAEFDKLVEDSISFDEGHSQSLSKEEKWILQFLDKVNPLLKNNVSIEHSKICRKFIEFIFHKACFDGDSMIHICVKSNDHKLMDRLWEILHKFQLYNLLNHQNYNRMTCAHLASLWNRPKVLKEFIEYGIDVNAVDADGNTALHIAIQESNDECVAAILSTNLDKWRNGISIDLNVQNDNGYTPLHLASKKNDVSKVEMLTTKAAELKTTIFEDVDGKHGKNALHIAIESGARDMAKYLIQNKCINPSKANKSGHTALYLARVAKDNELVNFIQRYVPIGDDENFIYDEEYASSKDSFESQETSKSTKVKSRKNFLYSVFHMVVSFLLIRIYIQS